MKRFVCLFLFILLALSSSLCFAADIVDLTGYWVIKFDNGSSGWMQLAPASAPGDAWIVNGKNQNFKGKIKIPACSGDIVVTTNTIGMKIGTRPGWCPTKYDLLVGTIATPAIISDGLMRTMGGTEPDLTFTMFKQ